MSGGRAGALAQTMMLRIYDRPGENGRRGDEENPLFTDMAMRFNDCVRPTRCRVHETTECVFIDPILEYFVLPARPCCTSSKSRSRPSRNTSVLGVWIPKYYSIIILVYHWLNNTCVLPFILYHYTLWHNNVRIDAHLLLDRIQCLFDNNPLTILFLYNTCDDLFYLSIMPIIND